MFVNGIFFYTHYNYTLTNMWNQFDKRSMCFLLYYYKAKDFCFRVPKTFCFSLFASRILVALFDYDNDLMYFFNQDNENLYGLDNVIPIIAALERCAYEAFCFKTDFRKYNQKMRHLWYNIKVINVCQ